MRLRQRLLWGPLVVALLVVVVSLPLLLLNGNDGSYSCRGGAIEDVIHPEPEATDTFRNDFFDAGRTCNHDARRRVAIAGGVLIIGWGAVAIWAWRRPAPDSEL